MKIQANQLSAHLKKTLAPCYLVSGVTGLTDAPLSEVLVQALYQGLFAAVLALLFYSRAVALLGAARGAVFAALVPGTAVLLAYPLLGEAPSTREIFGLGLVTLGMVWALGLFRLGRPRHALCGNSH